MVCGADMNDYELYKLWETSLVESDSECVLRLSEILCDFLYMTSDVRMCGCSRGFVSIMIEYILLHDELRLCEFVGICVTKLKMKLMKRDLLRISRYYYDLGEISEALMYMYKIELCSLTIVDVDDLLLNSPILLKPFNGKFLPYSIDHKYKPKTILNSPVDDVNVFEVELNMNVGNDFKVFLKNKEYDVIIDGENVIYSRMCSMEQMMRWIRDSFPLLGHHLFPIRILLISRHKCVYELCDGIIMDTYLVSRREDDDLYIIYSLLKLNADLNATVNVYGIITNDRYGDHISRMRLSGYLKDRLCVYDREGIKWCLPYSDCIMIPDPM